MSIFSLVSVAYIAGIVFDLNLPDLSRDIVGRRKKKYRENLKYFIILSHCHIIQDLASLPVYF